MTVADFLFKLGDPDLCSFNIDHKPYAKIGNIPDTILYKNILTYDVMVSELFCNLVNVNILTEDTKYEELQNIVLYSGFSREQLLNMMSSGCSFSQVIESVLDIDSVKCGYENTGFNRSQMLSIVRDIYTNELTKNLNTKLSGGN